MTPKIIHIAVHNRFVGAVMTDLYIMRIIQYTHKNLKQNSSFITRTRVTGHSLPGNIVINKYRFSWIHWNALLLHLPIVVTLKLDKESRSLSRDNARVYPDTYSPFLAIPHSHFRKHKNHFLLERFSLFRKFLKLNEQA